jgi:two-component system chemotaxis response regulator CheB
MDGLTALKHLMVQDPTPVVMLSTLTREGAWETFEALRLGAVDFVTKPNRLIASDVDVQLAQLEAKVRLANAVNRSGLHLLRPPSSGMHSRRERRREPARRLLVVAAVEGGCRAMLSALSVLAMEDGVGIVSVLEAEGVHLDAFAQYFCRFSRMPVVRPRPHQTIEAGVCYLVSANEAIAIATNGGAAAFKTTDGKSERHGKPADRMMADAAAVFGRHAAGLILCGSGGDGVVGLRAIKRAGGETMVPDPDACLFPDRVRRVIDSGLVDHVVPVRPSAD